MIYEKLAKIQQELKAPKNQYNKFGEYSYRSCEDILEAVKPLLAKYKCTLILRDDVEQIGDRYYVRATALLIDLEESSSVGHVEGVAWAREQPERPKMDASQLTGSCSSYARKYALNGLLLIDDVKDADTNEVAKNGTNEPQKAKDTGKKASAKQIEYIRKINKDEAKLLAFYKVDKMEDLTVQQASDAIARLGGGK